MRLTVRDKAPLVAAAMAAIFLLSGCTGGEDPLFERLPASRTGIDFVNTIVEDETLNPLTSDYLYNGGGVAVGDVNGDGRPDLYFAGNTVDNKLYLNRGDFHFDDVTARSRTGAEGHWATGVALVDINQDGLMDIYVCLAGKVPAAERANLLFVNQGTDGEGVPRFEEQAASYGLADTGYSTQAAFVDYDGDGDLDVYLLTNSIDDARRNTIHRKQTDGQASSTDRLYQNNGDGTFTDVSRPAGILTEGYGLGIVVSDINKDGWPDLYVANDFITNDILYVNNGDGTFTNRIGQYVKAQSHNGMGVDVADFNNDARPDIVVLDMLPPDNERQKMMLAGGGYDRFNMALRLGYEPQYVRNTLQLNSGNSPEGTPVFSEIGRLAGVYNTDWSWAPLFADFDNDGYKDLFISNGYGKDVTNMDFLAYGQQATSFGTHGANRARLLEAMEALPEVKLPNALFRNDGGLTFTNKTSDWGMSRPSLSNGAAFADLDGDGDLDLVTNNINDEAFVFENHAERILGRHYLRVRLEGPPGNRAGLGAKVSLRSGDRMQYHDHSLYRGYKSTVENVVHFGLGADSTAEVLEVYWPDGTYQELTNVEDGQVVVLRHADAMRRQDSAPDDVLGLWSVLPDQRLQLFEEVPARHGLSHVHQEYDVADFKINPLLPRQYSKDGPGLATGDVDGNGLDDVFIGADRGQQRMIYLQMRPGHFTERVLPLRAETHEDEGALFFDADGDGDQDLYVVSGGNVALADDAAYQDRLYVNDGTGRFEIDQQALPELRASGSCVTAADYDRDGDLDLFVGGRIRPGEYPIPPRSYLLRNDSHGEGRAFTDVTQEVAPELFRIGLVTSALWTDVDSDNQVDLMVAGEWMPVTLLEHRDGGFVDVTERAGLAGTAGWWNSLTAGDFDADGDMDYVAGNLGLNTKYRAAPEEPVRIYAKDYDDNGDLDPVLTRFIQGTSYPSHGRHAMVAQMIVMQRRFPTFSAYAEATFEDVFTEAELEGAYVAEAVHFETSYLENRGDGTLAVRSLPLRAQVSPVFGMLTDDFDRDGHVDLLLVGNSYALHPQGGWADASTGGFLKGDGQGHFDFVEHATSGFFVDGDAKGLAKVMAGPKQSLVLATQNNDSLRVFGTQGDASREGVRNVRLQPLDRYALLTFRNGETRRQEFFYGAGYLSQSSRFLKVDGELEEAIIYDSKGNSRTVAFKKDTN